MRSLLRIFLEPRALDEDARRREYILNVILLGSIVMLVVLDVRLWYDAVSYARPHAASISVLDFSIFPAFFIVLYALSRRGFFVLASYLLIGAYFLGNSYAAYRWGVNVPTALVGYALLIVIASILISPRFAFFVAGAIGLVVVPLWYVQLHGLMFTDAEQFTDGDGIAIAVLYGLITLVAWLSNREIEKSLARARRSERELKEERDLLEIRVEERTRALQAAELEKLDHLYRFAEFGQLSSGLFHDLLNLLQSMSLRIEGNGSVAPDETKKALGDALDLQGNLERFRAAFRRQLSRDEAKETFSLAVSIENVLQFLAYPAKRDGVKLKLEVFDDGGEVDTFAYFGSPLKFHQVVMNLVLNAIESFELARDNKCVVIRLMRESADVMLTVADNSSGIPADILGKIFDPFFTTKQGGDKNGIGIGLAITKRIVENDFGGTIEARNAEHGIGAIFTVRFPFTHESITLLDNTHSDRTMPRGHQEGTIT